MLVSDVPFAVLFAGRVNAAHGVLILRNEESDSVHEDWDPVEKIVDIAGDSLMLSVCNAVDGPVDVSVMDSSAGPEIPDGLTVVFDGVLECQPEELCLTDPNGDIFVRLNSVEDQARVRVLFDDPAGAEQVVIAIG